MTRAGLGFRAHSGWAAVVAVAAKAGSVEVVDRRKIGLSGEGIPRQPYHAAEGLELEKARELIRRCVRGSRRLADRALRETIADLRREGYEVAGCGLLLASGRPLPGLPAILASHALIHTADGEHFRDAIVQAAGKSNLPVTTVREKDVWARASADLLVPIDRLERRIAEIGKAIGPPWTQDQKLAAMAAWLALAKG
ncbi:MAG: hypothetical protein ACM3SU_13925 [Acidobacteriota bacterium]